MPIEDILNSNLSEVAKIAAVKDNCFVVPAFVCRTGLKK